MAIASGGTGTLEVDPDQDMAKDDTFLIAGEIWCFQRYYGRDGGLKGVLISRSEGDKTTRSRARPRPNNFGGRGR